MDNKESETRPNQQEEQFQAEKNDTDQAKIDGLLDKYADRLKELADR